MNHDNGHALSCPTRPSGPPALEQPVHRTQYMPGRPFRQFRHQALAEPPLFGLEAWGSPSASSRWRYRATPVTAPHRARSSTLRGRRRSGRGPPARSARITRKREPGAAYDDCSVASVPAVRSAATLDSRTQAKGAQHRASAPSDWRRIRRTAYGEVSTFSASNTTASAVSASPATRSAPSRSRSLCPPARRLALRPPFSSQRSGTACKGLATPRLLRGLTTRGEAEGGHRGSGADGRRYPPQW
jgi:hypothetical protein